MVKRCKIHHKKRVLLPLISELTIFLSFFVGENLTCDWCLAFLYTPGYNSVLVSSWPPPYEQSLFYLFLGRKGDGKKSTLGQFGLGSKIYLGNALSKHLTRFLESLHLHMYDGFACVCSASSTTRLENLCTGSTRHLKSERTSFSAFSVSLVRKCYANTVVNFSTVLAWELEPIRITDGKRKLKLRPVPNVVLLPCRAMRN